MLKSVGNPSERYGDQSIVNGDLIVKTLGKGIELPYSAIKSSNTSGDFTISVSGLSALSGSVWRKCSMLIYYSGIDGTVSNSTDLLTIVELAGLSTYTAAVQANIVGTMTISTANASTTGIDVTVDVSNSNDGSVFVVLLGGPQGASLQISITP
jgi:hypothetical protein